MLLKTDITVLIIAMDQIMSDLFLKLDFKGQHFDEIREWQFMENHIHM